MTGLDEPAQLEPHRLDAFAFWAGLGRRIDGRNRVALRLLRLWAWRGERVELVSDDGLTVHVVMPREVAG